VPVNEFSREKIDATVAELAQKKELTKNPRVLE